MNTSPLLLIVFVAAIGAWIAGARLFLRARSMSEPSQWAQRAKETERYYGAIGVFAVLVFVLMGFALFVRASAISAVTPRLTASISEVSVNDRPLLNPTQFVADLRAVRPPLLGHHSHPTDATYLARLTTADGPLIIILKRDSDDPHEYWAYYSDSGGDAEIGHVFTATLDQL